MTIDDFFTIFISLFWVFLILLLISIFIRDLLEERRLKNNLRLPTPYGTPLVRTSAIPHSHSVSSLSHVYMENGILNVRFGNPRTTTITTSSRDWSNPSAFIDRPQVQNTSRHPMYDFPNFYGLTKAQIEKVAPSKLHVKQPNGEKVICVICIEDLQQGQRRRDLPCGHSFHAKCILTWLQKANRCPCCTTPVVPRDASDDLPILGLEPSEMRRAFGFRQLTRSTFGERREQRARFLGLWSFSNRRVTRVQPTRRNFWDDRTISEEERTRILDASYAAHRARVHAVLGNERASRGLSTTVLNRPTPSGPDRAVEGFHEIRDVDSNQASGDPEASSSE